MPRSRRRIEKLNNGAVIATGTAAEFTLDEGDSIFLYAKTAGTCTITYQGSSDEGVTWYTIPGAPFTVSITGATNYGTFLEAPLPRRSRILIGGASNVTIAYVELVKKKVGAFTSDVRHKVHNKPDSIFRSQDSWIAEGFGPGGVLTVSGSVGGNNGTYTVSKVLSDILYVGASDDLVAEGPESASSVSCVYTMTGGPSVDFVDSNPDTIVRATGSFTDDGFLPGQTITVSGTVSNNGTYTAAAVTASTITLIPSDTLTTETVAATITGTATFDGVASLTYQENTLLADMTLVGDLAPLPVGVYDKADGAVLYGTNSTAAFSIAVQGSPDGGTEWFPATTLTSGGAGDFCWKFTTPFPYQARLRAELLIAGTVTNMHLEEWRNIG